MNFRFDLHKTLQASGVLLSLDANRMAYVRLLKLLYIADREWLAEAGRTITGDEAVAMKNGPVLSQVYDLIKGVAPRADDWGDLHPESGLFGRVEEGPGPGEAVEGRDREVDRSRRPLPSDGRLGAVGAHPRIPGVEESLSADASTPIPWQEMLDAQGKAELIEIAERDEAARQYLDSLFGA